jgi:anthranilate phosphoribosyltransferase
LRAVFEGRDVGAHRDTLLMGAALALECAGVVTSPMEGVLRAAAVIENGAAKQMLQHLAEFGRG